MNGSQIKLMRLKAALDAAIAVRLRGGETPPDDWGRVVERCFPCRNEGCAGWLDTAEPDLGVVRTLERCACGEFRQRLSALLGLRVLDMPVLAPATVEQVLRASRPLAWQTVAELPALTQGVWGVLCRQGLLRGRLSPPLPRGRVTEGQRRTAELVVQLELYQSLFFNQEFLFLPGSLLRRSFLPPARVGSDALVWASGGRVALLVLDAFLGRPPWSPVSGEVRALEALVNDLTRRGAGLVVFSSSEILPPKEKVTSFTPDYGAPPLGARAGDKGRPAVQAVAELLHPGALDRLWELLGQGQQWLDGLPKGV